MILTLERQHCYQDRAEGTLFLDGAFECFTLEPPRRAENPLIDHPAIPAGAYKVTISYSPKFRMMLPHLGNVPGRQNIEIHMGNEASETLGCILVGQFRGGKGILHSRDALNALMAKLAQELYQQKPVEIIVQDPQKGELAA